MGITRRALHHVSLGGRGTSVYYRIADESVYALCDLVCDNIARKLARSALGTAAFAATPTRAKTTRKRPASR